MSDLLLTACRELVDCHILARDLGLAPARERHKWACPRCGSSDALHIYQGAGRGGYCFSCGQGIDAIGLVQQTTGMAFPAAMDYLAGTQGFEHLREEGRLPTHDHRAIEARRRIQEKVRKERRAREEEKVRRHARARPVLTEIYHQMTLGPAGQEHLDARGIPEEAYRHIGIRSVEDRREWERLRSGYFDAELQDAGLLGRGRDGETYPVPWRFPVLVIPYVYRADDDLIDLVRFRDLSGHPETPKYLSPLGLTPTDPWGWHCYAPKPEWCHDTLYICEGEIDAISMQVAGMASIGCPGAAVWQDEWAGHCRYWPRIVVVGDDDEAGRKFCTRVANSFRHHRIEVEECYLDRDPSDLLRAGDLHPSVIRGSA